MFIRLNKSFKLFRCVWFEGLIYLIGGFDGQSRVKSVDIYDPITDQWSTGAEMLFRRATLAVAVHDNIIYAVGGYDGISGFNSMESYDPLTKTWALKKPMFSTRSSVGVAVLNNFIYASK